MSSDVRSEESVVDVRSPSSDVPVVLAGSAPSAAAWISVAGAPSADEVAGFMGDLVVVVDSTGTVTACNGAVAAATGRAMAARASNANCGRGSALRMSSVRWLLILAATTCRANRKHFSGLSIKRNWAARS